MAGALLLDLFVAFLFSQLEPRLAICVISFLLFAICMLREILASLLVGACASGDLEMLRRIKSFARSRIVKHLSLLMITEKYWNYAVKHQGKCLIEAIVNGREHIWKELLETAEVVAKPEEHICNVADPHGFTPLHAACKHGVNEAVKDLLSVRDSNLNPIVNPNVPLSSLSASSGACAVTPLSLAMDHNHLETAKILLHCPLVVAGKHVKNSAIINLNMDDYKSKFLPVLEKHQAERKELVWRLLRREEKMANSEEGAPFQRDKIRQTLRQFGATFRGQ